MTKALNVACLEATVIVCAWLGYCMLASAPFPSWSAIGFFAVGWFVVTAIRHLIVSRKHP